MLEDLDKGKGRTDIGKGARTSDLQRKRKQERMVQSDHDKRTRRGSKISAGIAGKQVINRRTALRSHRNINRIVDKHTPSWKGKIVECKSGKGGGEEGKSKDANLDTAVDVGRCEHGGVVCTAGGDKQKFWED